MINYKHTYSQRASILTPFPLTLRDMGNEFDLDTKAGRIGFVIEDSGHNPASIAKLLGCKPAAVYQWLDGSTKNLKEHLLWKLADLTGYEARWISQGEGPRKAREARAYATSDPDLIEIIQVLEDRAEYIKKAAVSDVLTICKLADHSAAAESHADPRKPSRAAVLSTENNAPRTGPTVLGTENKSPRRGPTVINLDNTATKPKGKPKQKDEDGAA